MFLTDEVLAFGNTPVRLRYAAWHALFMMGLAHMKTMKSEMKARVLVAATPNSVDLITEALSGIADLEFVNSLSAAMERSYDTIDVIVCSINFDESRMFDLLRYAKLDSDARTIPFICINAVEKAVSSTFEQSIQIACMALGAAGYVDLCRWKNQYGDAETCKMFRNLIEQLTAD